METSFLVLPGFTHFDRAEPRLGSRTSAWHWAEPLGGSAGLWLMVGAYWLFVLPGFTGDDAFDRCLGAPVERMEPKTSGNWAALSAIGSVVPSFLVLPRFTHSDWAKLPLESQTSAWLILQT
jgi:hypothetical protein